VAVKRLSVIEEEGTAPMPPSAFNDFNLTVGTRSEPEMAPFYGS